MNNFIKQAMQGMDEEQARAVLESLDEEQIEQAIQWMVDEMIIPHLEEVRQRARSSPATEDVRQQLESMGEQEREQLFYETLDELVAVLVECRENPQQGFDELKTMMRDPWTVEALLLIFENDEHIDAEYTDQLKEFGVTHLRWVGAMVLPEMYEDHEVEQVLDQFDIEPDPEAEGFSG